MSVVRMALAVSFAVAALASTADGRAADTSVPRAFVGTWASAPAHCDTDGVYSIQLKGWIEGETWMCELAKVERSGSQVALTGPCLSEQTSERAERRLKLGTRGGRLTHIDGLRVRRCR